MAEEREESARSVDRSVDCWFDYASPFAYLGTIGVERVAARTGARVRFRPFLLGALFREIRTPLVPIATFPAAKRRYVETELVRFARRYDVPFTFASRFPLRAIEALRLTLLVAETERAPLVRAIMRRTWGEDRDPSSRDELVASLAECGLDRSLVDRVADARELLRAETDEAVRLGVPGAPTFVVGDELFWGQDRLHFVEAALTR